MTPATWPEAFLEVGNGFVHVTALLGGALVINHILKTWR